ncbi:MAG TPA: DUF58 domain-containing protein [Lacunisphaera sp.]|jgi:uncharacterized protein (DUF58 family)
MSSAASSTASLVTSQLALLKQLEWRVRHAVENVLSGEYRSAFRGRGMEFDQVVKYTFGDDIRDIDWNVTARLGEPYRKKFIEEREVSLLLVFEDSVSLQFGSGAQSKREALLELAGLVMMLGAVNRDRVGFLHASPDGYTLKEPVRGRGQILHAAATLLGQPAPSIETHESKAENFIPWRMLAKAAPRHSIMIWLGDFPPRVEPEGWSVLSRRYQTMGFRVDDPWERQLPYDRVLTTYDPVAGRLVTLDGTSSAQRAAHAEWTQQRDAAFREIFPAPLSRLVVGTDQDRLDALVRFFHARMNQKGAR